MPTQKSVLAKNMHLKESVGIWGQGNLSDIPEKSYRKRSLTFQRHALRRSARCGGVGDEMPHGNLPMPAVRLKKRPKMSAPATRTKSSPNKPFYSATVFPVLKLIQNAMFI